MAATASRAAKRPKSANAAALLALAVSSLGPPSPFLRASDGELTAARGSYCWVAGRHGQCVDTLAPVTKGSLLVTPGDRIRVDMRGRADSLGAWLRGGRDPRRLRVHRLDSAHFTIRVAVRHEASARP